MLINNFNMILYAYMSNCLTCLREQSHNSETCVAFSYVFLKCHFKKRKKSRFFEFYKNRKKRILELWNECCQCHNLHRRQHDLLLPQLFTACIINSRQVPNNSTSVGCQSELKSFAYLFLADMSPCDGWLTSDAHSHAPSLWIRTVTARGHTRFSNCAIQRLLSEAVCCVVLL